MILLSGSSGTSPNGKSGKASGGNSKGDAESKPKTANPAGIAIFRNDKLIGEIKNEQIISHLLLQGYLKKVNLDVEDIKDSSKITVIRLLQRENPKIDVNIVNNKPIINIKIRLECDLITSGSQINYTEKNNKEKLSEAIKKKLTEDMKIYLNKISKEFKADTVGFGKYYRFKVLTLDELEKINWKDIFPNSEFNIEFQLHLDTTQMVSNEVS